MSYVTIREENDVKKEDCLECSKINLLSQGLLKRKGKSRKEPKKNKKKRQKDEGNNALTSHNGFG